MATYHVVSKDKGWKVVGVKNETIFDTKKEAVAIARVYARSAEQSLVIHSKDGRVSSVNSYGKDLKSGKTLSANVKHRLDGETVKRSIAEVISKRKGIK
jgi:hypothetical protein